MSFQNGSFICGIKQGIVYTLAFYILLFFEKYYIIYIERKKGNIMNKTQKVEQILNNFLTSRSCNDVRAEYIEQSDSYYCNGLIVLGGMSDLKGDEIFMDYCVNTLGLKVEVSVETLSFLHELGHHNTLEIISDEDYVASEIIKQYLYEHDVEDEERFIKYFDCPTEKAATINAIEFCNDNPLIVKKLDEELLSAIYE